MIYHLQPTADTAFDSNGRKREPLTVEIEAIGSETEEILAGQAIYQAYKDGRKLYGLDLAGADCRFLPMPGVQIVGCDITGTNFTGAYLVGANLKLSNVNDAIWTGCFSRGAKTNEYVDADLLNPVTEFYETHPLMGLTKLDKKWRQQ